jgi:hypothetical protein
MILEPRRFLTIEVLRMELDFDNPHHCEDEDEDDEDDDEE